MTVVKITVKFLFHIMSKGVLFVAQGGSADFSFGRKAFFFFRKETSVPNYAFLA